MKTYNQFFSEACKDSKTLKKISKKVDIMIDRDKEVHDKLKEENIHELSKDTMKSYLNKTSGDDTLQGKYWKNTAWAVSQQDNKGVKDNMRKFTNRAKGRGQAEDKLKEDVEQVDELSKGTLYNYANKGEKDTASLMRKGMSLSKSSKVLDDTGDHNGSRRFSHKSKELVAKARKRAWWVDRARQKLKEELLSELSQDTLKSYLKKSVNDAAHAYSSYNSSADSRNFIKGKVSAKDIEDADSIAQRWRSRKQGIYLAKKKLREKIEDRDVQDRGDEYADAYDDHNNSIPGKDRRRSKERLDHAKKKLDQINDLKRAQESPRGSAERKAAIEKARKDRNSPAHYDGDDKGADKVAKHHYLKSKGRIAGVANRAIKTFHNFFSKGV